MPAPQPKFPCHSYLTFSNFITDYYVSFPVLHGHFKRKSFASRFLPARIVYVWFDTTICHCYILPMVQPTSRSFKYVMLSTFWALYSAWWWLWYKVGTCSDVVWTLEVQKLCWFRYRWCNVSPLQGHNDMVAVIGVAWSVGVARPPG